MTTYYLEDDELKNTLINNGILHEVNRTFFHPLGMALTVVYHETTDKTELRLQSFCDENPKFDSVDKTKQELFRLFANDKFEKRENELGYIIQTPISVTSGKTNMSFQKERLEIISSLLQQFFHVMRFKFIKHSNLNDRDKYLLPKELMKKKIEKHIENEDWVNVACWSFLLNFYSDIYDSVQQIQVGE